MEKPEEGKISLSKWDKILQSAKNPTEKFALNKWRVLTKDKEVTKKTANQSLEEIRRILKKKKIVLC